MSEDMATRQKTCEERIDAQLAGRLEDFRGMLARASSDNDEVREDADTEIYATPLAVTVTRVVRIDLSTGGPGDWIEVMLDSDNEPVRAEYHFNDWFDHAERNLTDDDRETMIEFARYVTADFYFGE